MMICMRHGHRYSIRRFTGMNLEDAIRLESSNLETQAGETLRVSRKPEDMLLVTIRYMIANSLNNIIHYKEELP